MANSLKTCYEESKLDANRYKKTSLDGMVKLMLSYGGL